MHINMFTVKTKSIGEIIITITMYILYINIQYYNI